MASRYAVQNFKEIIKSPVDEMDSKASHDIEFDQQIIHLCSPYLR